MKEKIKRLETIARQLEPTPAERTHLHHKITTYADDFLSALPDMPTYVTPTDNDPSPYDSPFTEEGVDIDTGLQLLKEAVDTPGINPASPHFFGYIPGGGLFYAALGDYLAAVANRYAGIYYASPGAVRVENMLLRWMAEMIGYPAAAAGNLTSGGSLAHLIAIVTARDACHIQPQNIAQSVIYLTDQVHHSVDKALRIAGLQTAVRHIIPVDTHYRMMPDQLEQAIIQDKQAGRQPWLIIASAGTTNTGAVDPLDTIGDIAHRHALWFHVDGAYGAFFALCPEGQTILTGMDKSDSIIMDPHKTLFLPYGTGAVLVKDKQKLYAAHQPPQAGYMQDALKSMAELSPADVSPELTKHFRGLRLWLPLQLVGVAPFRAALSEKLELARYFYEQVQKLDGFVVGPSPDLSVVTYWYVPQRGDVNAFNQQLIQEIVQDGRIFISSTFLDGQFMLRLAVVNFRTHLDAVDCALDVLAYQAQRLAQS